MDGTGQPNRLHLRAIEHLMTGAAVHRHIGQMAIGTEDDPQHHFPFRAVQASRAGIPRQFLDAPPKRLNQPGIVRLRRRANGDRAANYRRIDMVS
jgi:hypothetical protein